jgi:ubiquinone biosynthesis protein UbiJ
VLQRLTTEAALQGLNHLLRQEQQARESLRALAGRTARIQAGPIRLQFAIAPDGSVQASDASADVTIDIDARALAAGLADPAAFVKDAQIRGDAEFAQVLSRVAGQLRPDPEEDLSRLVGDALAVRIVSGRRARRAGVARPVRAVCCRGERTGPGGATPGRSRKPAALARIFQCCACCDCCASSRLRSATASTRSRWPT